MKFGDQVLFVAEDGEEYIATVLNTRMLDDHVGADGQPLLDLGFFKEVLDGSGQPKSVIGTSAQLELVQIRHDVAHDSHEFSDPKKARYSGGRWTELSSSSTFTGRQEGEDEEEGSSGEESPEDFGGSSEEDLPDNLTPTAEEDSGKKKGKKKK